MAPVLGDSDDDDATKKPFVPVTGSKNKSNLLSLLPPPKNSISFAPKSSSSDAPIPTPTPKPSTSGFIPRSVSRPPPPASATSNKRRKVDKDSDESDDDDVAFFTLEKVSSTFPVSVFSFLSP